MYGIKQPGVENEKSIRRSALKYGLDTSALVSVNAADWKRTVKMIHGIPDGALFDSAGNYIEYRETDTSCNAGLFGYIPRVARGGSYRQTGKTSLAAELKTLRTLKGDPLPENYAGKADFYLLIYWTAYAGRLNEDHVNAWEELAAQNTKAKIEVIDVNMDFQEYWPKAERDTIMKGRSK